MGVEVAEIVLGTFVILASWVGMGVEVGGWEYQGHVVREVLGGGELQGAEAAEERRDPQGVGDEHVEDISVGLVGEDAELVRLGQVHAGEGADVLRDRRADVHGDGVADGVVVVGLAGLHLEEREGREAVDGVIPGALDELQEEGDLVRGVGELGQGRVGLGGDAVEVELEGVRGVVDLDHHCLGFALLIESRHVALGLGDRGALGDRVDGDGRRLGRELLGGPDEHEAEDIGGVARGEVGLRRDLGRGEQDLLVPAEGRGVGDLVGLLVLENSVLQRGKKVGVFEHFEKRENS